MIVGQLNTHTHISNNTNSTLGFRAKYKTEVKFIAIAEMSVLG